MIRSMTAFARHQEHGEWGELTWEVRSVNHRYLEATVRLPEDLRAIEPAVRDRVTQRLGRGKVDIQLFGVAGDDGRLAGIEQHVRIAGFDPERQSVLGEQIDHVDGVTIEEAEHMMATRLWQNTAKVHFDTSARPDGSRLIYGGHVISMARALSFNGLANAQMVVGLNGGAHANPCLSGDTVRAWSEVLDKAETSAPGVGALRLRLVATKGGAPFALRGEDGKYLPDVLLDLDYWVLVPM